MDQEAIMRIQEMEHETNHLNEQLRLIDQNANEMNDLIGSLDELENGEAKEIMVNIGKKIFLPVEVKEKHLVVDIGKGNFVKRKFSEAKKIVSEESNKLMQAKQQVLERLNSMQEEMQKMIMEYQKAHIEGRGHVHGPDCDHDHDEESLNKKEDSIEDLAEGK